MGTILKKMQRMDSLDVKIKACRPRFKAGSELSGRVNKITIDVDQVLHEDQECLDVDLKWETQELISDCE